MTSISSASLSDYEKQPRFIVVTGGSLSGLGKGTCISSLGICLKAQGFHVTMCKIDPYLNLDAGTMSPFEHGECFVLEDGTEADLDLGNYERFLNISLNTNNSITTGKLYAAVQAKERRGDYLGKTVQIVPHVTDHLSDMLLKVARTPVDGHVPDVVMVEVGGTVGDLESAVFLESISRMRMKLGRENVLICHLGYVPILIGEQKTKPTQSSIRTIRMAGLEPDFVICRCEEEVTLQSREKIATHGNIPLNRVVSCHNVSNIYRVPLVLNDAGIALEIGKIFNVALPYKSDYIASKEIFSMDKWAIIADLADFKFDTKVVVGIAGKYVGQTDTYLSVVKAVIHAALNLKVKYEIKWIDADDFTDASIEDIKSCDCIIIPGGFGDRGVEGKIKTAEYCRVHKKPLLGICLGFQLMSIEYCRNVLGLKDSNSEEFTSNTANPVVIYMPETRDKEDMGGTMVLGDRVSANLPNTRIKEVYGGSETHTERHRHRYEINPKYVELIEEKGDLFYSATDSTGQRRHALEISDINAHPYYMGVQAHPEMKSRPQNPAPLFVELLRNGLKCKL